jgi:hypothetical protein
MPLFTLRYKPGARKLVRDGPVSKYSKLRGSRGRGKMKYVHNIREQLLQICTYFQKTRILECNYVQ